MIYGYDSDTVIFQNINTNHTYLKWNINKPNIFKNLYMMDLPTVVDFQRDLKIYGGFTNFQTSLCLYEFLYNSYTIELRACVNNIYSSFENIEHSEEIYLY